MSGQSLNREVKKISTNHILRDISGIIVTCTRSLLEMIFLHAFDKYFTNLTLIKSRPNYFSENISHTKCFVGNTAKRANLKMGVSEKQNTPNFCFRKFWRALIFWNTRFKIRPFAFLPKISWNAVSPTYALLFCIGWPYFKKNYNVLELQGKSGSRIWQKWMACQRQSIENSFSPINS